MSTKKGRAEASETSADDLTLVEKIIDALPEPGAEATIPAAFVVPGLSPKFPPALLDAVERMAEQVEIVAKARAGVRALESKAAELQRRAASLKEEIERSDGSAAAAVAMGIERDDPDRKAKVETQLVELAVVEKEITETARAQAAAPALFEQIRKPLTEAIASFRSEYADAERAWAKWAAAALPVLEQAIKNVKHFAAGIERYGEVAAQTQPSEVPPGHPLALFPQLRNLNRAIEVADSHDYPLAGRGETAEQRRVRELNEGLQREHVVSFSGGRN